jgi:tetratricopeptide (TPR) repeat protein
VAVKMRQRIAGLTIIAAVSLCAGGLCADRAEPGLSREQRLVALVKAQEAFERGTRLACEDPDAAAQAFCESAAAFQSVIDSGVENGRLYYDLANAQLQLNDLGHAIANYLRAQRLIPGDGRLEANLQYARSLRRDQFDQSAGQALLRTLGFWHYHLSARTRLFALLAAYVAFWLVLTVQMFFPRWRLRPMAVSIAVVGVLLAVSLGASLYQERCVTIGVITANDVVVRKGNGEGYAPRFEQSLHAGVEFEQIERRGDWLHISLPDGRDGWVQAKDVEAV